jgi:tetratricopeptide (TPR) repeat protein
MSDQRRRTARWLGFGLLALLVGLAWANGLSGAFTYDDKVEVVGNRTIRTLEHWDAVLAYNASRPLVILSWALDWRLWGLDPTGYHVVNVLIHLLNAGLAFLLGEEICRRLELRQPLLPALIAAALWAVHPMTTEAVTYITGRSESLCATFYLAAVLCWMRWRRGEDSFQLLLALGAFLLAAATKEVAATIPATLLLLELLLPGARPMGRRGWLGLAPFWLLLVGGAVARKLVYGVFTTDLWLRPPGVQLATEAEVVLRYLQLWLLPVNQSVFHDHPPASGPLDPHALLAAALLLVGVAVALWQLRQRPWLALGLGWFLLLLAPSSSIVPLKETMAEHRSYLAGWGLCLLLILSLRPLLAPRRRAAAALVVVAVALLLGGTHLRNRAWRSEASLWLDAVERNPRSAEAWYGYGDALRFSGSFDGAIEAYGRAVELDDLFLDAWNNLGIALAEQGRLDEARRTWLATLQRHPSYCRAHNNLGWLHYRQQAWEDAIAEFRSTLVYCPENTQAHFALGNIYYGPRRDPQRALHHYHAVLEIDPAFPERPLIEERRNQLNF